jgi:hypothetical protein
MAYGHAERVLAAIWLLESETRELLTGLAQPTSEQSHWLQEVAGRAQTSATPSCSSGHRRANDGSWAGRQQCA